MPARVLKEGEEIKAKFIGVDRKNRTITLSIKAKDTDEEQAAISSYKADSSLGMSSLGDILKDQLNSGSDEK